MDATAYVFISLLVVCGFGLGATELDTDISGRLKPDPRLTRPEENDALPQDNRLLGDLKREWSNSHPDMKFSQLGIGKRTLDYLRFHTTVGKRLDLLTMIRNTLDKSRDLKSGNYLGDWKRDWSYSYPDLKFSQLGIGKRTLDYLRFHTTVGKRLDLLTMIGNTLDKSRDLKSGNYLPLDEQVSGRFGSRLSPVRRSLRNRKDSQRMSEERSRVMRGRRQDVDPILYLIGIGK